MSIADLVLPYVNHGQSNTMRRNRIDFAVPSAIVGGLRSNQTVTVNLFDKSGTLVDGARITNSSELEPIENSAIGYDITMHYHTIYGSSGQFNTSGSRGSYTFNANTGALTYTRG